MLCPLKLTKITRQTRHVEEVVEKIEVIAIEAKLGLPPDPTRLTPLEWHLLILHQRQEAQHDLNLRLMTLMVFQQLIGMGGRH